jgi:serine phosphatase RsbU (regulator of sigma subunit)
MPEREPASSDLLSLQDEAKRLKRAVEELSILNDLARAIGASLDSQDIMHTIVRRSLRAIDAEQGVITLVDQHSDHPMKTLIRTTASSTEREHYHFNQSLLGWMHLNKKPLLLNDPRGDRRFEGVKWDSSIHSLLCVPLMVKSELKGVLTVYNKKEGKQFSEEDQRLLAIIAAQSAQVVENARLNEREKMLLKMQEELRLAAKIQADLLPGSPPEIRGYEAAGRTIPAQLVGGDYFDFFLIDESRLVICLGDVSGKGLPASLLMANVQATLRGQAFLSTSAKECVRRSSKLLFHSTNSEKFVTLFYGILNTSDHTLCFTNAGHEHPYLFSSDCDPVRLHAGGIALGMLEEFPFEEMVIPLRPGDLLVVCSDGITEAMNDNQEQFGDSRLENLIRTHRNETPDGLIDRIVAAVKSFVGGATQTDDMTLVVVKRAPSIVLHHALLESERA